MFSELFKKQKDNQEKMIEKGWYKLDKNVKLPVDNIETFSYHIQQLVSEIGEVLECDKRWKNFRVDKYDKDAKLEELADCFIVWMNVVMFSGFSDEEMLDAINNKLDIVSKRISKED